MKKEDFIEKTKEKLSGNSKQIVLDQIDRFYKANNITLIKLVIMYS